MNETRKLAVVQAIVIVMIVVFMCTNWSAWGMETAGEAGRPGTEGHMPFLPRAFIAMASGGVAALLVWVGAGGLPRMSGTMK